MEYKQGFAKMEREKEQTSKLCNMESERRGSILGPMPLYEHVKKKTEKHWNLILQKNEKNKNY